MLSESRGLVTVLALVAILVAGPAFADEYQIDPNHSTTLFKISHLGAGNVFGVVPDISGTLSFDAASPENCAVSISVKPESLSTFNPRRDTHLKSADFFNTKEFPEITFSSVSWKRTGDGVYELEGDFTLLGVTKRITIEARLTGTGKDRRGVELAGFETTFTIDRTEYSMNYGVAAEGGLGKDVTITVALECQKQ